jgi:antitoxin component of RelBE/YafQ-DinJ toxin-antitoxin module
MQTQAQVTINLDKTLKEKVQKKARKKGITISSLTNSFFKDFVENEQTLVDRLEERMFDSALQSTKVKKELSNLGKLL